jgi:uncharacterized membrane protein (DUF4010 family)
MVPSEYEGGIRLGIATLIGLGAGVEREWSGHTTGPDARFAGVRTFTLLGVLGGVSGLLVAQGHELMTLGFVLGGVALVVCAYVMAMRRPASGIDGTTEAAALTVLALATLAGTGWVMLAAGAGSLMVLALSEKQRLHGLVRNIGDKELHAALQFSVLALVVLPLLPAGPLLGDLGIRPRALWIVVLLFSALNFAGYLARHAVGPQRGYGIAGALGGVVSSTAVTLNFARQSRAEEGLGIPLARGVIAACTVLVPRVLIVSAVLSPAVAMALAPRLLPAFLIGLAFVLFAWRHDTGDDTSAGLQTVEEVANPLRLTSALKMAIAFQIALSAIAFVRAKFGSPGLYGTAAALGLTDVDALTVSMSSASSSLPPALAARVLTFGILSNTLMKLTITAVLGRKAFRLAAVTGLLGLAAATAAGMVFA